MTFAKAIDDRLAQSANPTWWNLAVVVPWTLGLVLCIHGWQKDRAIASREKKAPAIVTAHEPKNHNRYGYTFPADGYLYTGWDTPRSVVPQIGQEISIYYDPRDPATNSMADFSQNSLDSFGPVPLVLFGIGGVTLFVFWKRRISTSRQRA